MRITITALGTRGDVQPMIALSKGLQAVGYEVTLIAGSNFESWIKGHGLGFVPSLDMEALMNSDKGIVWSESSDSPLRQVQVMRDLLHEHGETLYLPIIRCAETTDLWIGGFTSESFVQAISEKTGIPYLNALLQPQHPTRSGAASVNPILAKGDSPLNRWMGRLIARILWSVSGESTNNMRTRHLGLPPHSFQTYQRARRNAPIIFGFSAFVVPPPSDWEANAVVCGYWFLDEVEQKPPSAELNAFLEGGEPPVYIGFGSMSHRDPQGALHLILEALHRTHQRAVIATGWNSTPLESDREKALVVNSAPHDWLFPQVRAVVHHGGAGTTAAGLRAGKPTLIIPHMSDQPYWGRRVYELGVGAKPIPRHKLTAETLAAGIDQLIHDQQSRQRAHELGERIHAEKGIENAVQFIQKYSERVR